MTDSVAHIVEPFVRRGLFDTPEDAVAEMARDYVLRQIEHYRHIVEAFEAKYGMTYERFDAYLRARSDRLAAQGDSALSQAVMLEEEDAFDWQTAREMLRSWLGLQAEVAA